MLAGKITAEDEEDILGELDAIVSELTESVVVKLPSVPETTPAAIENEEEEELQVETRSPEAIAL